MNALFDLHGGFADLRTRVRARRPRSRNMRICTMGPFDAGFTPGQAVERETSAPRLPRPVWNSCDYVVCIVAAVSLFVWTWNASGQLGPAIFDSSDVYFEADNSRVFHEMIGTAGGQQRSHLHPLFSMLCGQVTQMAIKVAGLEPGVAVRVFVGATAAFWIASLFALFRLIGLRTFDAAVFVALGGVSSASMFWFSVPETFPFGAVSLLVPLLVLAASAALSIARVDIDGSECHFAEHHGDQLDGRMDRRGVPAPLETSRAGHYLCACDRQLSLGNSKTQSSCCTLFRGRLE